LIPGVAGLLASPLGLRGGLLAALLGLAPLLLLLGLLALGVLDGLLGLGLLLLGAAGVGDGQLLAQLGRARLGVGAARLGVGLVPRGGALRAVGGPLLLGFLAGGHGAGLRRVFAHSGGSSPNARTQIRCASFVVAMEASAPRVASSPDHIRRLTMSLSVMIGGV
jgi:hypothetical protein